MWTCEFTCCNKLLVNLLCNTVAHIFMRCSSEGGFPWENTKLVFLWCGLLLCQSPLIHQNTHTRAGTHTTWFVTVAFNHLLSNIWLLAISFWRNRSWGRINIYFLSNPKFVGEFSDLKAQIMLISKYGLNIFLASWF